MMQSNHRNIQSFYEEFTRRYVKCDVSLLDHRDNIFAEIIDIEKGSLAITSVNARGMSCQRPSVNRHGDVVYLILISQGRLDIDHYGQSTALAEQDFMLVDSLAECNYIVSQDCRSLVLELDRDTVCRNAHHLGNPFGRKGDGRLGIGQFVSGMFHSIATSASPYRRCEGDLVKETITHFVTRGLEGVGAFFPGDQDILSRRVKEWIHAKCDDPDLSPTIIAVHFGLSLRSLYRLFLKEDTTPSRWIWQARLDRAYERLEQGKTRSVTEVAYDSGFNDASHFTRMFKSRFGILPRDIRN